MNHEQNAETALGEQQNAQLLQRTGLGLNHRRFLRSQGSGIAQLRLESFDFRDFVEWQCSAHLSDEWAPLISVAEVAF